MRDRDKEAEQDYWDIHPKEKKMVKKYHVDLTSLVVDHRTYEKLNSDKFQYSNRKEFLKRLVDDDIIEIVNIEEADEDVSIDNFNFYKYFGEER
jgi:hypothetical protein